MFDPLEGNPSFPDVFITDAHYEHVMGFDFPAQMKYSTKETRELYEADRGRKVGNWKQVQRGRRIKVGQVEIEAHDAGHVLGAVQYEIITPEGNVVYSAHVNLGDTLLARAAEVAPCDLLVVDTSFASPSRVLPPRESVIADIVKWTLGCIKDQRIPAFETDIVGTAQELVRIFNTWTEVPVIVHPRIARVNRVYESNGVGLHYQDASTGEASKMMEDSRCTVIVPKRTDMSRYGNFRTAYVSGWATRVQDQKNFPLSDRADFNQLLHFVEEARPKTVLTCFGGRVSELFAQALTKRIGIQARPLITHVQRVASPTVARFDEKRISRCEETLLELIQTPNFTYERTDLLAFGLNKGFRNSEVEETLRRLTANNVLEYSRVVDGYRLSL
jgi:putative mRNA 3-end processing factor